MEPLSSDTFLIFDLDGTLWDSSAQVAESWNIVLKKHMPELAHLTAGDIQAVMGKTMTEIAQTTMPDMDDCRRSLIFGECERFEIDYIAEHGGKLFPAVRNTLKVLKDRGFPLAIVSNCQTGYIHAFLLSMQMKEFFCDYEEWGNTLKPKAENIRLVMERNGFEKAVYIGDTIKDYDAARAAGIPFIHAAYGFGTVSGADAVLTSFDQLLPLLG